MVTCGNNDRDCITYCLDLFVIKTCDLSLVTVVFLIRKSQIEIKVFKSVTLLRSTKVGR